MDNKQKLEEVYAKVVQLQKRVERAINIVVCTTLVKKNNNMKLFLQKCSVSN